MKHLVTFKVSYDEEFQASGFTVFTTEEVDAHFECIEWLRNYNAEITINNNHIVYFPNGSTLEECFTIKPIDDDFADALIDKFNTMPFGVFLNLIETMPDEFYNQDGVLMGQTYLVKFSSNYADEFDVTGVAVFTQEQVDAHNKCIEWLKQNSDFEINWYFGTNESISFTSVSELVRSYRFIEITPEQETFLIKEFDYPFNGFFMHLYEYMPEEYYKQV